MRRQHLCGAAALECGNTGEKKTQTVSFKLSSAKRNLSFAFTTIRFAGLCPIGREARVHANTPTVNLESQTE